MAGNDVLFGEGQDDDLFGGAGHDRIYGGTGEDGMLGDDGRIIDQPQRPDRAALRRDHRRTPRSNISLPGPFTGAWIYITGRLEQDSRPARRRTQGGNDVIYGGLGDDFMHGGAGDDGVSAARPRRLVQDRRSGRVLHHGGCRSPTREPARATTRPTRKLAAYDANNPLHADHRTSS